MNVRVAAQYRFIRRLGRAVARPACNVVVYLAAAGQGVP